MTLARESVGERAQGVSHSRPVVLRPNGARESVDASCSHG